MFMKLQKPFLMLFGPQVNLRKANPQFSQNTINILCLFFLGHRLCILDL